MARLSTVTKQLEGLKGVLGGEEAKPRAEGVYHGLLEDYVVIEGNTLEHQRVIIAGRPVRTSMNAQDIEDFLTDYIATELEQRVKELARKKEALLHEDEIERLSLEVDYIADRLEKQKIKQQIRILQTEAQEADSQEVGEITAEAADIDRERKEIEELLEQPNPFTEIYAFKDDLVVHMGHTELPLREYGYVHYPTQYVHVPGAIDSLPGQIDIGRKVRLWFFDPYDLREVEDGGELKILVLSTEQKLAIQGWLEKSVKLASVVRLVQDNRNLTRQVTDLQEGDKSQQRQIGILKREVRRLEFALGTKHLSQLGFSNAIVTFIMSTLGLGLIFGVVGVIAGFAIPPTQTQTITPITNGTLVTGHDINTSAITSPFAVILPMLGVLVGVALGIMLSVRRTQRTEVE